MTTLKTIATTLLAAMTLAACNNEKKPEVPQRIIEDADPQTGIISLRDYTLNDTVTVGGKLYNYTCTFEHVDSMPVLINPQGLEYHESRVSIAIRRDSTKVFAKTFYKNDFRDHVPADFLKNSTVVGVNYNFARQEENPNAFYFIVTVGDPDETSDLAYPLEMKIDPNGTFLIRKAENLETAPISTGLNIDPSEDAV